VPRVRDVLCEHPRVLFVGINPGLRSGEIGHHFAGKGNPFYRLLYEAKLVPELLSPEEDQRLCEWKLALVNLCTRVTRTAAELTREELARGRARLLAKSRAMQPQVVALVGVTLYPIVCGRPARGAGAKSDVLAGARVFVLPNPSGLNASYPSFAAKLVWFRALARYVAGGGARPST
jgi:TDG/mug DNA glycosylase family protein